MNILNEFVTYLAGRIGGDANALPVAWVVTIVGLLFLLWLLHLLLRWYFRTNEILANQEHLIELLESRAQIASARSAITNAPSPAITNAPSPARISAASPPSSPPPPVRQHPIDDEFSEILNVRPHNLDDSRTVRPQPVLQQPVTNLPSLQPPPAMPNPPPATIPQETTSLRPPSIPPPAPARPATMTASGTTPGDLLREAETIQAKPANTSVTMLGSAEQRAERQMEAQEAMRLAEEAANATRSKTADIPDIPTSLVRTYSPPKTNPLTGRRNRNRNQDR